MNASQRFATSTQWKLGGRLIGLIGVALILRVAFPLAAQPPERGSSLNSAEAEPTPIAPQSNTTQSNTSRAVESRAIGTITGQGTAGTIAKFTGTNTIGNSVILEKSGKIAIGTSTPADAKVTVQTGAVGAAVQIKNTTFNGRGLTGICTTGTGGAGVYGLSIATDGNGVLAEANTGSEAFAIWGKSTSGEAGHFTGKVVVNGDLDILGNLSKDSGTFKIDHPLDPANKYLSHSFVESPDMMNIYNGNVTTDAKGFATVMLPNYFRALNRDYRYQLTVIGTFAQAIVARKIDQRNRFMIRTDKPNVEVSWQVTGIRSDAYAKAHPIQVVQAKQGKERGAYLHPELFGHPREKGIHWAKENRVEKSAVRR